MTKRTYRGGVIFKMQIAELREQFTLSSGINGVTRVNESINARTRRKIANINRELCARHFKIISRVVLSYNMKC